MKIQRKFYAVILTLGMAAQAHAASLPLPPHLPAPPPVGPAPVNPSPIKPITPIFSTCAAGAPCVTSFQASAITELGAFWFVPVSYTVTNSDSVWLYNNVAGQAPSNLNVATWDQVSAPVSGSFVGVYDSPSWFQGNLSLTAMQVGGTTATATISYGGLSFVSGSTVYVSGGLNQAADGAYAQWSCTNNGASSSYMIYFAGTVVAYNIQNEFLITDQLASYDDGATGGPILMGNMTEITPGATPGTIDIQTSAFGGGWANGTCRPD